MKAVRFDVTIPGFLLAKSLGRIRPSAMFGALGTIALRESEVPSLPGPDWVELEVLACGICGSDLSTVTYSLSPVPDEIDDDTAVLTEPFSIALHAVLRVAPVGAGPVLVIGSGTIALATIWALRATGYRGVLVSQTKRTHEARLAMLMGATEVVRPGSKARDAMIGTGAAVYKPIVGGEVFSGGGFPLILDCVGSRESLSQSLGFATERGGIVVLGCAAKITELDLSFLWARELTVRGSVGYAVEKWQGRSASTFELTHELMRASDAPLSKLVTHKYNLEEYRQALDAAADHRQSGAIKVVLTP